MSPLPTRPQGKENDPVHVAKQAHRAASTKDTLGRASTMSNDTTPVKSSSPAQDSCSLTTGLLEVIAAEMEHQTISADQVAEEAGVSPEEMARKLTGQETLYVGDLYSISTALGWEPSELIEAAVRTDERR